MNPSFPTSEAHAFLAPALEAQLREPTPFWLRFRPTPSRLRPPSNLEPRRPTPSRPWDLRTWEIETPSPRIAGPQQPTRFGLPLFATCAGGLFARARATCELRNTNGTGRFRYAAPLLCRSHTSDGTRSHSSSLVLKHRFQPCSQLCLQLLLKASLSLPQLSRRSHATMGGRGLRPLLTCSPQTRC